MEKVATGKPFTFLTLLAARPVEDEELGQQLQMGHLAHLFTLEAEGKASVFGPILNHDKMRGIIVLNSTDREEIKAWMATDPYIKDGYLTYELFDFFTIPGQKIKEG